MITITDGVFSFISMIFLRLHIFKNMLGTIHYSKYVCTDKHVIGSVIPKEYNIIGARGPTG